MKHLYFVNGLFQGKKTYLVALIGATYALLDAFGVVDFTEVQEKAFFSFIAVALGVTIHAAINRTK